MRQTRGDQIEFGFAAGGKADGYRAWVEQREEEIRAMARKLGLPLGHAVEVWLKDGTLLKGRLLWRREGSNWELLVGRVGFSMAEIQSCIRVD